MSPWTSRSSFVFAALAVTSAASACEASSGPSAPNAPVSSAPAPSTPAPSASSATPAMSAPVASSAPAATDAGAAPAAGTSTLFVAEKKADCEGEGPRKCLRVRTSEAAPWTLFYGTIEGFSFEEGTAYELRVATTEVPRPAADAPAKRYRLVEIVSKRKVTSSAGK